MTADSATRSIGEKLLQGWTMLGDVCPKGCNTPLMRSPNNSQLVCCSCGTDFMKKPEPKASPISEEPVARSGPSVAQESHSDGDAFAQLTSAIHAKVEWIAEEMRSCTSRADLSELLSLADQLVSLRRKIDQ